MSNRPQAAPSTASVGTCPACGAAVFAGDRFCGGCGAAVPQGVETELLADLEQVTLGEYEIRGVLGRGGMGLVYLAHDLALNRKVAIKVLPPSMLQGEAGVERFRREARIAAALRHRNITSVFGLKETTKLVFFLMEYVEGRTLDAILHDEKRLGIDVVEAIIQDAAGALSYAHRREVVHRDLKPANIIIDTEGMAMITDFGVAKLGTSQGLTTAGATVGSPKYMSPEQWSGKATGFTDQYSLGCVAYELLAGRAPFEGDTIEEFMKQHLFDAPRALSELRPETPPALADGIMRMLEKDPGQRWPSLEAAVAAMSVRPVAPNDPARQALAQFAKRGHDVRVLPKTPKSPIPVSTVKLRRVAGAQTRFPDRRLILGIAAAVLLGIGVAAYVLLSRVPPPARPGGEAVAALEIAGAPATLEQGERVPLKTRATNAAGGVVADAQVTWSTSDSSVAVVAEDGTLRAVGAGTATLTASSSGRSANIKVTVPAPRATVATVEVTPHAVRLAPGASTQVTAVAMDQRGNAASGRRIEWSTSDPAVVAVSATGVLTGGRVGTALVTAASEGRNATMTVVVGSPAAAIVVSLEVNPSRLQVAVRGTAALRVIARDARGNIIRPGVDWTSSAPSVAAVGPSGVVTGVSPGTTTITARSGGVTSLPAQITVIGTGPAAPAVLQLLVAPAWAFVSIDGLPRGQRTRLADTLPSGVGHRLHVERDGFVIVDTTITLQPNEQRLVRILLIPKH
jgi:uncharacterized protein YjdB/predicted Ser/Thr protein kinase